MSSREEMISLGSKLDRLSQCVTLVLDSLRDGVLKTLFQRVLDIGNYLNYGSRNGDVPGFLLDSLFLLKSVKSVDGSTTLLR